MNLKLSDPCFRCNFEESCPIINGNNNDYNWFRNTGPTPTPGTGPMGDVSTGSCTANGNYLSIHTQSHFFLKGTHIISKN